MSRGWQMLRANCVSVSTADGFSRLITVYDGQKHLGDIAQHGQAWMALDGNGDSLGIFPNRRTATAAVIAEASR